MRGPKIARRTILVSTWDHRSDDESASIAQHRFLVSRFADRHRVWYCEH